MIALALVFNVGLYFVFLIIFDRLRVPAEFQERLNFWGSVFALITMLVFIVAGVALLERFHWSSYLYKQRNRPVRKRIPLLFPIISLL